ncbi:MAG TPA: hypothetical protein VFN20_16205, partial [Candidatus Acidoferrum sp.]|nr:hypothetical protein [Candidatus Acidoferrum sp.]
MLFPLVSTIAVAGFPVWRAAICLLVFVSFAYYVIAIIAAARFFLRERRKQLSTFAPPISLLKPVRGVDFASYENFKSFCLQDYP